MDEVWKAIDGFEGIYEISNHGNVKSIERYVNNNGGKRLVKERVLTQNTYPNGYHFIGLHKDGKVRNVLIHRLVAQAFIPNPLNLPEVNHKDECITNNAVDNLEWCTSKYNANYGTRNERCFHKDQQKAVIQKTLDGEFIKRWNGIGEAAKALGINDSQIIRVCKKKKRNVSAGGFKWEYANE